MTLSEITPDNLTEGLHSAELFPDLPKRYAFVEATNGPTSIIQQDPKEK